MSTTAVVGVAVVGDAIVGNGITAGQYLYWPPTWRDHVIMRGSLRTYVDSSTTVYRVGGQWFNVLTPGMDTPSLNSVDVDPSGLVLYFNTPTPVPANLHDELAAVQPADPSWSPGSLIPL